MKSFIKIAAAGIALLTLTVPLAANAQQWRGPGMRPGCGWRHRDIAWDRRDLRAQWRDIHRDRWELRRDLASGNWAAAQAERNDLRRDYMNVRQERWELHRDYQRMPRLESGYVAPMSYVTGARLNRMPPTIGALPVNVAPASAYAAGNSSPVGQYYQSGAAN